MKDFRECMYDAVNSASFSRSLLGEDVDSNVTVEPATVTGLFRMTIDEFDYIWNIYKSVSKIAGEELPPFEAFVGDMASYGIAKMVKEPLTVNTLDFITGVLLKTDPKQK